MSDTRPWFKLDVGYLSNPKIAPLLDENPRAVLFHLECIAYAKQHRTNGIVPMRVAMRIACAEQCDVDAARNAGLIQSHDATHVRVHDFVDHQGEAERDARRSAAGRKAALARWNKDSTMPIACESHSETHSESDAEPNAYRNAEKRREEKSSSGATKRGTRLPEDWEPAEQLLGDGSEKYPRVDLDYETERFRDYWLNKTTNATKLDWSRAWRTWMLKAEKDARAKGRPIVANTWEDEYGNTYVFGDNETSDIGQTGAPR